MTKVYVDSADVEECAYWFATGLVWEPPLIPR